MSNDQSQTARLTDEQHDSLMSFLGLTPATGMIGIGAGKLHIYIWKRGKAPKLNEWEGWPLEFHIGGGRPRAFGGQAA